MRVSSTATRLAIAPGASGDLTLDVVNTGNVIDGITARIVGVPEHTVSSHPPMLPLFPDAAGQITLTLDLPQSFPAGRHPMTVEVHSRQVDAAPGYVNVDLDVPLAPAVTLASRPELVRARRTGRFILTVTNRGNAVLDIDLAVHDAQKTCAISIQPRALSLPPGVSAEAVVTVRGRRMFMGTDSDRALVAEATARTVSPWEAERPPGEDGVIPDGQSPSGAELSEYDGVLGAGPATDLVRPGVVPAEVGVPESGAAPVRAPEPLTEHIPLTFRQRPYVTRGVLTALILLAIIALWAAAFLFGLSKVFAGDPLTKSAPASFFAATPEQSGASGAAGAGSTAGGASGGTAGSGGAGSTSPGAAGSAAPGAAAPGPGPKGLGTGPAPAGAVPKTGTLPAGVGGTIAGTVTAASSGDPVGRILVSAMRVKADGSTVPVASAATQADGSYQVSGLFPGPYVLQFSAPGFTTTYYPAATEEPAAKKLTAVAGQVTGDGNAVVRGLPATISGSVDFGDNTAPAVTTVSARLLGAGSGTKVVIPDVKTDAKGAYRFANLPAPGNYLLTFTTQGYETTTEQTTVTGGANRFVSTAVLAAGAVQISGSVTDGTNPLGGATVSTTVNGQQISTGTPTTGQVGHFVIDNLPTPATYIITVSKQGYGQVSQVIDLAPGAQRTDLVIPLLAGTGVVSGIAVGPNGAGVGGATVTVGGLANPPTTTTLTDGQIGAFSLSGLPVPGTYTLTVTANGFAPQTVPVTLTADKPLPPISVPLTASAGTITGTVTGANGAGMAGVNVVATDGQKSWPVVTTSAAGGVPAGGFTIAGLPSGRYTITASDGTGLSQTTLATVEPGSPVKLAFQLKAGP
ncbi:MAG: hypothetical protein BGO26_11650 [Actinobacteria bacterium 69-20]|nr:carboxypeptidase regulatory-like domain-containing protein [Actinomycetota bacterium]OJV26570.1 MAG: hypothetical protein BGO26_11650 [Actinobacteria bacterium 69-20]